ncbi:hypothetical protein H0O02_03140 [Candidatus Micrarchaeota archaeon]|nr:hypothetical protein [Candidatus Micrarchaeota archaeon]
MRLLLILLFAVVLLCGCTQQETPEVQHPVQPPAAGPEEPIAREPPQQLPEGVLVGEIPADADVIFSSMRYVLNDPACLDGNYELKGNFINDADCNRKIYASDGQLASRKQLFVMDLGTEHVTQITNTGCHFIGGQAVDSKTIMANAACSDTDGDGRINDKDAAELYLLHLDSEEMDCLTCGFDLTGINNPDYSPVNGKTIFSAGSGTGMNNHLYTIDAGKNLVQLTNDSEYMDFDCSWSEDGTKIAFSRLPQQNYPWTIPTQVWIMGADGMNAEKITNGGANPSGEENQGPYPIGIDADPDMSPDNREIAISRLKTGKLNEPFGVYELVVVDVDTKDETILDSNYANMVPEWKEGGILFIRQTGGSTEAVDVKQSLYLYKNGAFEDLEGYPYNVFPLGAHSASWIER